MIAVQVTDKNVFQPAGPGSLGNKPQLSALATVDQKVFVLVSKQLRRWVAIEHGRS